MRLSSGEDHHSTPVPAIVGDENFATLLLDVALLRPSTSGSCSSMAPPEASARWAQPDAC